ncbi:protein arginine kinase [Candidatus Arthromitus sp. SFB-rat-Yit]|uniref:protein arginine kinase n=1 Tax=Candidatus Arthromitus sp. SFB-rat-Yit TaxID=1041504 RepID=UPI000227A084|nr:protein arginine kinase [Candidatus Arthromitus sp. SFB-rat-Yit]BAK81809.1 ATP:guanido phosphotransferase [Candidatus Arthromitus sp. SFB-rat-Yit]
MLSNWINLSSNNSNNFILSSRVRLARNLKGVNFPHKLDDNSAIDVIDKIENGLTGYRYKFKKIKLNDQGKIANNVLLEKHLISNDLIKFSTKSACFINEDQTISIMVNEEDHLRMQFFNSGYNLKEAFDEAMELDDFIERKLDYAFDEKIGYLTTCPTNLGTGMRTSVMMHLPALSMTDQISKVYKALTQIGMTIRGLYGEGSKIDGNIFQISNQITLGVSEKDILNNLHAIVNELIDKERNVRKSLFDDFGIEIKDKIFRSVGILGNCYSITSKEALEYLSYIRLGIEEGILETDICMNGILIGCQPASLQLNISNKMNSKERDIERAKFLRNSIKNIKIIDKN